MRKTILFFGLTCTLVVFLSAFSKLPLIHNMVKIEGGTFKMGSKEKDVAADNDNKKNMMLL